MTRLRLFAAFWLTLSTAACVDDTSTPIAPETDEPSVSTTSLDFVFPVAARLASTTSELDTEIIEDGEVDDLEGFMAENPLASIRNARTWASITSDGTAQLVGSHYFKGNYSTLDISGNLSFNDQYLTSITGSWLKSEPLFYGTIESWMIRVAKAFSDKKCGLYLSGQSKHGAWFRTLTPGETKWGDVVKTSYADPATNGACETEVKTYDPRVGDGSGDGSGSDSTITCYYLITYDLETGVIYDVQFLYCTSGGDLI